MTPSFNVVLRGMRPAILLGLALLGCGKTDKAPAPAAPAPNVLGAPKGPALPKVPFGNQPCQSLTAADEQSLGMENTVRAMSDRAPATLPYDNMCSYTNGGSLDAQVSYMVQIDYETNHNDNHSSSRPDPTDLPGAFYDKQGGLWFMKNGYFVVIAGESRYKEKVAHVIEPKL